MSVNLFLALAFWLQVTAAPSPEGVVGYWLTPPNEEEGAGVVEIRRHQEGLVGRLVWLEKPTYPPGSPAAGQPKVDRKNPNPKLRQRPVLGLEILQGFRWDGEKWVDGEIYDPVSGKTYKAQIRLQDPQHLALRGYVGIPLLGRSEVWTRLEALPKDRGQALPDSQQDP